MANPFAMAARSIGSPTALDGKALHIFTDHSTVSQNLGRSTSGFSSNVLMSPVMWVMRAFTEAQLVVQRREVDAGGGLLWHRSLDSDTELLVRHPNAFYSADALWKGTALSYTIDGNAYWWKVRNIFGDVVQLWYVPHWMIRPVWPIDGSTFISHYEMTTGLGPPLKLPPRDVVHFRFGLDPDNPRLGYSPLKSILREVLTDDEAALFSERILGNMGVPGLVVSPSKEAQTKPGPDDVKRLQEYFDNGFKGPRRGTALVLGRPTEIHQFGFDPNKLMLPNLRDISEERVCAALGIPSAVVGFGSGLQSTKVGAPQPLSARLWSPAGPTTMGAVRVGDPVATPAGWQTVEAVYPQGEQDIYRVTFQDGSWAECTADHLWRVKPPKEAWQDRPLADIAAWPWWKLRRTTLPLQGVTEFTEKPVLIPPYVMGLLLADGSLGPHNLQFTSVKPDVVAHVTEEVGAGYAVNQTAEGGIDYRLTYRNAARGRGLGGGTGALNPFKDELRRLGLWGHKAHEKFVPDEYKYTSARARRQLLQGLFDGDGFVNHHGQPAIEQTSPRLADDITEIVQSLGGYTLRSNKRANRSLRWIKGRPFQSRHDRVHLSVVIENGGGLFATPAKRDRCRPRGKLPTRKFRTIEFVRREQAQCIKLSGGLYLTDSFLVTHNTMRELVKLARVQCLHPMMWTFGETLTAQLLPDFVGTNFQNVFRCRFDVSEVSAFQEDAKAEAERVALLVREGILRVDRGQQALGLEVDQSRQIYLKADQAEEPEIDPAPTADGDPDEPQIAVAGESDVSEKALDAIRRRWALPAANGNGKH